MMEKNYFPFFFSKVTGKTNNKQIGGVYFIFTFEKQSLLSKKFINNVERLNLIKAFCRERPRNISQNPKLYFKTSPTCSLCLYYAEGIILEKESNLLTKVQEKKWHLETTELTAQIDCLLFK